MGYTDVTVLLDRSGSMADVRSDVIGGLNEFVKLQTEKGDEARITLVQFDTVDPFEVKHSEKSAKDFPILTDKDFEPRGGTPLLDSLGKTINATGERIKAKPDGEKPTAVIFVVLTDGLENSSHEFSRSSIKAMIEHQTQKYNWMFVYLGANQDAFAEGGSMGFHNANNYGPGGQNVQAAIRSTGQNVNKVRAAVVKTSASLVYDEDQIDNMNKPRA